MTLDNAHILKEILEQSLAGYWDWHIPTGNEYLSPSFKRMFGYDDHEMENHASSWQKIIVQEELPGVLEQFNRHVESRGKIPFYNEVRYHHKNGSIVWVICTGKVIEWDEHHQPIRMVGCHMDITKRKEAETAVLQSEDNYRFQFMNMTSYNSLYEVVTDETGKPVDFRFIMVNHAYEEYVGKNASELIGKTLLEVYPGTEQYWIDTMAEVVTTGNPVHFENFSQVMDTHTDINLYIPQTGQLAMTTSNITQRKQAEEALRESEEKYKILFENAGDAILIHDLHARILAANPLAYTQLGYTEAEILATPIQEIDIPEEAEKIKDRIAALQKDGHVSFETVHQGKDGRHLPMEVNARRILWEGQPAIMSICRDITQRKLLEAEREKTEQQLHKMQKLESLGVLAGGIAHDFNNLMGGIFGYIDLALQVTQERKVESYLSNAVSAIHRARALTLQLLTFARGGAPVREVGYLFPFIEETALFILSGAQVNCSFEVQEGLWTVCFDKNQIGQVIDNIILNATQAMPQGGTITIGARNRMLNEKEHPVLTPGAYVQLSIQDTGVGIPPDLTDKIFDPFFTTKEAGHGLGLATCYSIIKRHDGCIEVESTPGKGTTFTIFLPAKFEAVPSADPACDTRVAATGTFLIMEDDPIMRQIIREMLETLGFAVISTENGQDALDRFKAETLANRDLTGIIFDLTIPGGMGGTAALQEIRKQNTAIPAFVASGYAEDPVMKNPTEFGFTASLCKPFKLSELTQLLRRHLPGSHSPADPVVQNSGCRPVLR